LLIAQDGYYASEQPSRRPHIDPIEHLYASPEHRQEAGRSLSSKYEVRENASRT
jgi:hypothetical protein